ncbi:MAG: hypothetical protein WDM76_00520 [Limisphaerales bacterium]
MLKGAKKTLQTAWPFIVFESKPTPNVSLENTLEPLFFLAELGYQFYIPGLQRRHNGQTYYTQAGRHPVEEGDRFSLMAFTPETRLLYYQDLNVFACPPARHQQLLAAFK